MKTENREFPHPRLSPLPLEKEQGVALPIHTAVRVSYPERGDYNWYDALATYQAIGAVEVAFYRPELFLSEVQVEKVVVGALLKQVGVTLCWETFAGRRRFLSSIEGIAAFCASKTTRRRLVEQPLESGARPDRKSVV